MKKNFRLRYFLLSLISGLTIDGFTQAIGDFQTKNSTGSWSDFNAWNKYNGSSWIAATTGQVPGPTSSVFVQAGHTISVDNAAAVCKDLKVNGDNSSKVAFSTTTSILNITGNMLLFSASHNCFGAWAAGAKIVFSGSQNQSFTNLSANTVFLNTEVNKSSRTLSISSNVLSIDGTLTLTAGTLNIGTNGSLIINGPLVSTSGILDGTATSDISITGTSGGSVLLPVSSNISLKNVTISGNRTLIMDGLHNISLNGTFTIASGAIYDNGGESQITNGGGSISITGKFINRDKDNFTGINGAIPGIIPLLNPGCTIEYGLDGNQVVTARSDYQNITFSGSGTKTPSSTFTPIGTLYITGSAIIDASGHNIGDGTTLTNFNMDGGRLILGTTGRQPMMAGSYNLTGGIIQFNGASAQTIRSKSYQNIEVTGVGVGNSNGNITLNSNGTFTVKNYGIFVINDNNITGSDGTQMVTVENGGIFRCGNNQGFNGFTPTLIDNSSISSTISNINLNTGSTVEYMRGGDQPVTNANSLIYGNLSLAGSGTKTAPSGTLTIQGNLTKSGTSTFDHNNGTVLLNGTTQTFAGLTYNNLILTGGNKTTSGSSTIIDSIKINDGTNLSVSSGDVITLHSDASKTARVGQIVTGTINYNTSGKFMVERYIPAKKAWRFLAVPVNPTQTIKDSWQEGASGFSSDPNSGYGTQITSDNANWSSLGFDALSFGPSVKTYNSGSDTYTGIASTNSSFDPNKGGYMTFIRGDRSATAVGSAVTSTTLRTAGTLFTGDQPPVNLIAGQFIPVNNPYASALDLRNISRSNSIFYYVWDPNRGGSYGFGGFTTLSWDGSTDYDVVPANAGSYGTTNNYIASGQAFFVSGTGGPVQITENAKTPAIVAIIPFTRVGIPSQKLRSNLYSVNAYGNTFLADGVLISFGDNYSNNVDGMDAKKIMNASENLSLKREGIDLAIERRNMLLAKDTIFFNLSSLHKQQYRFEFIPSQLSQTGLEAYLEDSYLKTRTRLNLNDTALTDFVIDNNAASAAPGRFRIVFDAAGGVLPVTFTNVKAYPENENIAVEWNVENEAGLKNYEVEKSSDGTRFTPAVVILANKNPVNSNYKWIDGQPVAGYNYYRIKSTGTTGEIQFSKTVRVWTGNCKKGIAVFPNPSGNGIIHLQFNNQPQGKYRLRLMNNSGQVIQSAIMQRTIRSSSTETIPLGKNIAHGLYRLHIVRPDNTELDVDIIY